MKTPDRRLLQALALFVVGLCLLFGTYAYYRHATTEHRATPATVQEAETPDPMFGMADDEDTSDCDAEDRRRNEMPDCGYLFAGTFRPWSWVKQGRQTPPYGWRAATERAANATSAKPVQTRTAARPAAPSTAAVLPMPATTKVVVAPPVVRPPAARPKLPRTGPTRRR